MKVIPMMIRMLAALALIAITGSPIGAQADRPLVDAMRAIYGLRTYTAFDWISAQYQKGTLTLQGFVRTPQLKAQAEQTARKTRGIEEVDNRIEVLPTHQGDDDVRLNAYIAIYGSSALERYAPGGQLSGAAVNELRDTASFGLDGTDVARGPHAIHIVVNGARILLLGEVRTTGDRQLAEGTLRSLPGVLGVVNQLRVRTK
jgi:osmotically-inducible protein OsmY